MSAAAEYERLLRLLHAEFRAGRGEGEEADRLRDAMDEPWYQMTGLEQAEMEHLSEQLDVDGTERSS